MKKYMHEGIHAIKKTKQIPNTSMAGFLLFMASLPIGFRLSTIPRITRFARIIPPSGAKLRT